MKTDAFYKIAVVFVLAIIIGALLAPVLAPYEPNKMNAEFDAPPSAEHLLGTDQNGRDVLSRLLYASRITLLIATSSVLASTLVGVTLGILAAYRGGIVDMVIMRAVDLFMSFPEVMLIMVLIAVLGNGIDKLIFVIALLAWPQATRITRSATLQILNEDYLIYARFKKKPLFKIIGQDILPNILPALAVHLSNAAAAAILTESSLSFLGLGVKAPNASWGNMLTPARSLAVLTGSWWIWVPAGVLIALTVFSVHIIGDRFAHKDKQ